MNNKNNTKNNRSGIGHDISNHFPQFVEYYYKNFVWHNDKVVHVDKCSTAPGLKYKNVIYKSDGLDKEYVGRHGCHVEKYLQGIPEWATPDMIKRYNTIVYGIKERMKTIQNPA